MGGPKSNSPNESFHQIAYAPGELRVKFKKYIKYGKKTQSTFIHGWYH
jgi:hypothetical protein